jgi:hypothetical protein
MKNAPHVDVLCVIAHERHGARGAVLATVDKNGDMSLEPAEIVYETSDSDRPVEYPPSP